MIFSPPLSRQRSRGSYQLIPDDHIPDNYDSNTLTKDGDNAAPISVFRSEAEQPKSSKSKMESCFKSQRTQASLGILIVLNAIVIGLETDIRDFYWWDIIEHAFLLAFLLELCVKYAIGDKDAFHKKNHPDFMWNLFDIVVIGVGIVDLFVGVVLDENTASGFPTIFRMIRLMRILRIFRIVRFLRQLYLLAYGLTEAAQAVFWVTILMTFVLYVCAIIMVRTLGRPDDDDPNAEFLLLHFGTVFQSMLTLFEIMSAPNLPLFAETPGLLEARPLFALFLVGFIVFGSFGMIALLTGVINESMFEKNCMRQEEMRNEQEQMRKLLQQECGLLFDHYDLVKTGEIKTSELVHLLPKVNKLMETSGVFFTLDDIKTMLFLMDKNETGRITKEHFIRGVITLAGGVKSISVEEVHRDVCRTKLTIDKLSLQMGIVLEMITAMSRKMSTPLLLDEACVDVPSSHGDGASSRDDLRSQEQQLIREKSSRSFCWSKSTKDVNSLRHRDACSEPELTGSKTSPTRTSCSPRVPPPEATDCVEEVPKSNVAHTVTHASTGSPRHPLKPVCCSPGVPPLEATDYAEEAIKSNFLAAVTQACASPAPANPRDSPLPSTRPVEFPELEGLPSESKTSVSMLPEFQDSGVASLSSTSFPACTTPGPPDLEACRQSETTTERGEISGSLHPPEPASLPMPQFNSAVVQAPTGICTLCLRECIFTCARIHQFNSSRFDEHGGILERCAGLCRTVEPQVQNSAAQILTTA